MSTDHIPHSDVTTDAATAGAGHPVVWSQLAIENQQGAKGTDANPSNSAGTPNPDVGRSPGTMDGKYDKFGKIPDMYDPPSAHLKKTDSTETLPVGTDTGIGQSKPPIWGQIPDTVTPRGGSGKPAPDSTDRSGLPKWGQAPDASTPGGPSGKIGEAPHDPLKPVVIDNPYAGVNQVKTFDPNTIPRPDTGRIGEAPHDPLKPVIIDNPYAGVTKKTMNNRLD